MELSLLLLAGTSGSPRSSACSCRCASWRRAAARPGRARYGVFFAAIGLGYLAVEIALLQKFGLFLGHPNYALSVVLAALLLSTGVGALASEPILRVLRVPPVAYALAVVVLLERLLVFPLLPVWRARLRRACRDRLRPGPPSGCCWACSCPPGLERLKHQALPSCPGPGASTASSRWSRPCWRSPSP